MFLCFCFESGDFWFFLSNIQQFWRMLDIDLKPAPTLLYLQFWCLFCLMLCARSLLAWPSELEVGEGWTNWLITAPPHPPKSLTQVPTGGRCSSKVCWDNVSPEQTSLLCLCDDFQGLLDWVVNFQSPGFKYVSSTWDEFVKVARIKAWVRCKETILPFLCLWVLSRLFPSSLHF